MIASLLSLTIWADGSAQDRRDDGDVFEDDGRIYPGWLCAVCQAPADYAAFAFNAYWSDSAWALDSQLGIPFRVYNLSLDWVVIWFEDFLIDLPSLLPNTMKVRVRLRSGEIVTIDVLQDGPVLLIGGTDTGTSSSGEGGGTSANGSLGLTDPAGPTGVVAIVDPDPDGMFPAFDEEH